MKSFSEFLVEGKIKKKPFNKNPKIGWWLDNNPIRFYHGTHIRNIEFVEENGLLAPTTGDTAGWISLALEPNTAHGYASMSGAGGETAFKDFRAAGTKSEVTDKKERVVFIIELPQKLVLSKMAKERGAMQGTKTKLINKEEYDSFDGQDQLYYALTEIRMPDKIDPKYIKGYMKK
jgi:hypothetical protein